MPRTVYMAHQDKTYVYDNNDNLVSILPGQIDAAKAKSEVHSSGSLKGPSGGQAASIQLAKDSAVNAASQLPLMLMPGGAGVMKLARPAASLISGFGLDRILNGENKSVGDSAMDAGLNTLVSEGTNHLVQNPPTVGNFDKAKGWGARGIIGGIIKSLQGEPLIPEVAQTTPVLRGAGGQYVSNKASYQQYLDYVKKKSVLDRISNALGFGINTGIDYGMSSKDQQ